MSTITEQKTKTPLDELIEIQNAVAEWPSLVIPRNVNGAPFFNTPEAIALVVAVNTAAAPALVVAAYASEMTLGGHQRLLEWPAFQARIAARVEQERNGAIKCAVNAAFVAPPAERPVLVTTEFRGVFFGYATDTTGDTIHLKRARNCLYWSADAKGFLGLASAGPTKGCKVGPEADIDLRKITCVAEVTPEAVKAWAIAPWAK